LWLAEVQKSQMIIHALTLKVEAEALGTAEQR
jgi:hypothetical protein